MKLGWGRFRTKVLLKVLVVLCPGSVYRVLPSHQLLTSELDQTKMDQLLQPAPLVCA